MRTLTLWAVLLTAAACGGGNGITQPGEPSSGAGGKGTSTSATPAAVTTTTHGGELTGDQTAGTTQGGATTGSRTTGADQGVTQGEASTGADQNTTQGETTAAPQTANSATTATMSTTSGGGTSGPTTTGGGVGVEPLSFETDIWPLWEMVREPSFDYRGLDTYTGCTDDGVCHGGSTPGAGLAMPDSETAYAALIDVPSNSSLCDGTLRVAVGDPDNSCLVLFYVGRLGKDDLDWVTDSEIELMREWIRQGALR